MNRYWKLAVIFLVIMAISTSLGACTPAQSKATIGIFNPLGIQPTVDGFKSGLAALEYVEDDNITYVDVPTPAGFDPGSMAAAVQELIAENSDVDMIYCVTTPACLGAMMATTDTDITVIFVAVTDPVAAGLVESFSSPGGNVTGIASAAQDSVNEGRRLQLLLEIAPDVQSVYLPYGTGDPVTLAKLAAVQDAADKLGVELITQEIMSADEAATIPGAIPDNADAIFTFSERIFTAAMLEELANVTIERGIPYSAPGTEYGALTSFAPDLYAMGEQAARLADQAIKGTQPADLPVEVPEFFLVINAKTAEAIGLEIPEDVYQTADQIVR